MKKLLICLTVLFSAFLFTGSINAAVTFESSTVDFLQTQFGNFDCETIKNIAETNNIDTNYYDSFILSYTPYSQMYNYLYFFNSNNTYNVVKNGSFEIDMYGRHIRFWNIKSFDSFPHDYNVYGLNDDSYIYYKGNNYYIINNDYKTSSSVYFSKNYDCQLSEPKSYKVTFHLNGGIVTDSYESELERKAIIEEMKTIYNDDGILDEYPSINQDWLKLFINPSLEKIQDFFDKYLTNLDKQTKLLPLYEKIINKEYLQPTNYYEDYTIELNKDILDDYLLEQTIKRETMSFKGWYYDDKFIKEFQITDELTEDIHLYANWGFANVEDFLNKTNFNTYTFDENYQYAVISLKNQQNRDIYLGLGIMSHSLEVYKYSKLTNEVLKGSSICLTPIYSKNDKYYYHLDNPINNEYEVLIIPKEKLNENYEMLLSDNAYITYTNDLKSLIIKDDDGNDLTIDIEDSYNYSQDNLLNSGNDLLEIFKDLTNNKDNNIFSYFNQVWNLMKTNKLFVYFITLIIGALIILIIKAASR